MNKNTRKHGFLNTVDGHSPDCPHHKAVTPTVEDVVEEFKRRSPSGRIMHANWLRETLTKRDAQIRAEEREKLLMVVKSESKKFLEVMPERQKRVGGTESDYKAGKFNAYADAHLDFQKFTNNLVQALTPHTD